MKLGWLLQQRLDKIYEEVENCENRVNKTNGRELFQPHDPNEFGDRRLPVMKCM
jgi:hypothetical protein